MEVKITGLAISGLLSRQIKKRVSYAYGKTAKDIIRTETVLSDKPVLVLTIPLE